MAGEVVGEAGKIRKPLAVPVFQALKSRLVGGVIFEFLPCFVGVYGSRDFRPPICHPTVTVLATNHTKSRFVSSMRS